MDLYRVNLNLLIALDILLAEKSVTAAAKKLFITQAAMSNNLQQLRVIFKDELLAREKNQMVPTHYAKELQPKLNQLLQELKTLIVDGQRFVSEKSERIFKIGMADYMVSLIMPQLLAYLKKHAPGIKIRITPLSQSGSAEPFENGEYDLAIGKLFSPSRFVRSTLLFEDTGVCIVSGKHPLAKKKTITLKEYLSAEHIAIAADSHTYCPSLIEQALTQLGVERNVALSLSFITPMFKLIEQSDYLLGTVIKSMAQLYQEHMDYVIKPLPFKMQPIELYLVWHQHHEADMGHQWLRNAILQIIDQ